MYQCVQCVKVDKLTSWKLSIECNWERQASKGRQWQWEKEMKWKNCDNKHWQWGRQEISSCIFTECMWNPSFDNLDWSRQIIYATMSRRCQWIVHELVRKTKMKIRKLRMTSLWPCATTQCFKLTFSMCRLCVDTSADTCHQEDNRICCLNEVS